MSQPERILIVDDDEKILFVLKKFVENLGYDAVTAENGEDAINKLNAAIDLVLLDLEMPVKDGLEVTKWIREQPEISELPIIIITAHTSGKENITAMDLGADDFIAKPIDFIEIKARISSHIRRKNALDELKQHKIELEKTVELRTAKLHKSREELRFLVEGQGEGVAIVNQEETFTFVNPAAEQIFGLASGQMIGRNLKEFISEDGIKYVREQTLLRKQDKKSSYEIEITRPDGQVRFLLITATPRFNENKDFDGVFGIFRDITERKNAEMDLSQSREMLRNLNIHIQNALEKERTSIAREVHDEFGSAMTALKLDLSWLEKRFNDNQEPLFSKTKSMRKIIDSTIDIVDRISSQLRPVLLEDLGLSAAIAWYTKDFQERSGITCHFDENSEDWKIPQNRSIAIFRIFQESLNNVIRHARASQIEVKL
ncbi:MAG: response regulator, partial [Candidatus Electryonea clarkiae]|nr:response regulator [Candidatus Electryonea clarkiae]